MKKQEYQLNRRTFISGLVAAGIAIPLSSWPFGGTVAHAAVKGGTLRIVAWPATKYLNSAITTSGGEAILSPKMFDGLVGYDFGMKLKPSLASSWEISANGLRVTFNLRRDVKWHDGKPFTSRDVALTFMKVLKVYHGRGRSTFADLQDVETPDAHTAVFVMKRPAPAMMKALSGRESPILPSHLYEGTNIMENPHNTNPVGTGPFKLASYERGASVVMERNPDYWNKGLPLLDRIIYQYVPDASTRAAMLESGQADLVFQNLLSAQDTIRLGKKPEFELDTRGYEASPSSQLLDFNLEKPILKDVRVRRAIAHAIDNAWIVKNVFHGFGEPGASPIHYNQKEYYSTEGVASYPLDLKKAEALLDEAGHPRGSGGVRFNLMLDPSPWGTESITASEYVREQLRQIGIKVTVRTQDFGQFIKTVWTDRKHDLCLYIADMGADPTIGVQRFYWSKNFKPGVAFSNGSSYSNPEVDALLEASQVELNPAKRKEQFLKFQQIIMRDIPTLPIVSIKYVTIANRKVKDHTVDAVGPGLGSLERCWIDK